METVVVYKHCISGLECTAETVGCYDTEDHPDVKVKPKCDAAVDEATTSQLTFVHQTINNLLLYLSKLLTEKNLLE